LGRLADYERGERRFTAKGAAASTDALAAAPCVRGLEALLARPELWRRPPVSKIPGSLNHCHENVARFYLRAPARRRIVTGWALHGDDVVWRQHTWAFRGDDLCESTVPAKLYYGVVLNDDEAVRFARAQIEGPS
jgi:hypothetical protein